LRGDAGRRPDQDRRAGGRIARAAFEAARDYALERKQLASGSRVQAIQHSYADMSVEIDAARARAAPPG
jgi:alkylation response protein AidB-like acyl-CoA dehydrogenase